MDTSGRRRNLPIGFLLLVLGGLPALPWGCAAPAEEPDAGAFEFFVWGNGHADDVVVWVDGVATPLYGTQTLTTAWFDSYRDAVDQGVTLETRDQDGGVISRCVVHAGACRGACAPSRETVSVCVFDDRKIWLNTWDCPCDGYIADYSCSEECSLTGPQ